MTLLRLCPQTFQISKSLLLEYIDACVKRPHVSPPSYASVTVVDTSYVNLSASSAFVQGFAEYGRLSCLTPLLQKDHPTREQFEMGLKPPHQLLTHHKANDQCKVENVSWAQRERN